jgi:hypothetical protein
LESGAVLEAPTVIAGLDYVAVESYSLLHLALRVFCVPHACGAFFGWVVARMAALAFVTAFVCSGFGLSKQSLELGDDLLDRMTSGENLGRKTRRAPRFGWHVVPPSFLGAEIVEDSDVARLRVGLRNYST